jgi:hypothetical protein
MCIEQDRALRLPGGLVDRARVKPRIERVELLG